MPDKNGNTSTTATGNGFAPVPPERDAQGVTASEFMSRMFEFEYCGECGKDAEDHTAVIDPMGNWFAFCKPAPVPDYEQLEQAYRDGLATMPVDEINHREFILNDTRYVAGWSSEIVNGEVRGWMVWFATETR